MAWGVNIDGGASKELDAIIARLPKALASGVLRIANVIGGHIARVLQSDTRHGKGQLARSFLPATFISAGDDHVTAGALSDLPYAEIQDKGGTIRPRTASNLAIPLTSRARSMWPRDWPRGELTLIKSRRGNVLLAKVIGGRIEPQYVLKKRVDLRPMNYTGKAIANAAADTESIMPDEVEAHIEAASR